jgi:macrophage erythroblast attacher
MADSLLGSAMQGQALSVAFEKTSVLFRSRQKAVEHGADVAALDAAGARAALTALRASLGPALDVELAALAELKAISASTTPPAALALDAAAADALLRTGRVQSGALLAEGAAGALVDAAALREVADLSAQLRGGGGLGAALAWVSSHASRLRRLQSSLEYSLREAAMLALLRGGDDASAALAYATRSLAPLARAGPPAAALPLALSALVWPSPWSCGVAVVEALFAPARRGELADRFEREALAALGFAATPPLRLAVAAGVAALKTPACATPAAAGGELRAASRGGGAEPCPLCTSTHFAAWLDASPMCVAGHTTLRCPISGELLDEENPPLALPNGRVFGSRTVQLCTSLDGAVCVCPRTGETFPAQDVRRVFFL